MRKDLLGVLKGLAIGIPLIYAVLFILSFGLTGKMPHFPAFATRPLPVECALRQQDFATALPRILADILPEKSDERWQHVESPLNTVTLHAFYTSVVEVYPDLTCAVAFLRDKDIRIPAMFIGGILARLHTLKPSVGEWL